jgi:hypothetical protein
MSLGSSVGFPDQECHPYAGWPGKNAGRVFRCAGNDLDETQDFLVESCYPTQAKKRLEWGTQPLLLEQGVGVKAGPTTCRFLA